MRSDKKQQRHQRLLRMLQANPLLTDEELSERLKVSVSTLRLDRAVLNLPELRERMRTMAEAARSRLISLNQDELVGELLELEPNQWALSMMETTPEMAFRHTTRVWEHFIYAQASSLAIATIAAELVVPVSARLTYKGAVSVGDRLMARTKVGIHREDRYVVGVRTRVQDREVFSGKFIVMACSVEAVRGDRNAAGS